MGTMNIFLPDALKTFVDNQVSQQDYSTSSEYVQKLTHKDQGRQQLGGCWLERLILSPLSKKRPRIMPALEFYSAGAGSNPLNCANSSTEARSERNRFTGAERSA